jgi:peroxiredoxin Q/BCP
MRSAMVVAAMLMMAAAGGAQTPAPELKVGDPAPDFSLQASDGKTYKLSDFKGKQAVVLAWFPKAFTQGCTIECKSLAEHGDLIKKYNVKYFMASVDPIEGEQGNKAFAAAHNADFPLLSDPTKQTAEAYGVLNGRPMASRWTFYIGKDGKILAIDKTVKPATSAEDMAAKLGELKVDAAKP